MIKKIKFNVAVGIACRRLLELFASNHPYCNPDLLRDLQCVADLAPISDGLEINFIGVIDDKEKQC